MKNILVTGGCGYIGSHTTVELLRAGYRVTIVDNLSNSDVSVLSRIKELTGEQPKFLQGDIADRAFLLNDVLTDPYDAVIHFAGLKAVAESVAHPERYYMNNVAGSKALLDCLLESSCRKFVFSSSATVYGDPASVPISESAPLSATNPYGQNKLDVELMLKDLADDNKEWDISILRYFNPVAAHESGLIGEDPSGVPNNLLPYIAQVAVGLRDRLQIYGNDYPTKDGTGVRDYIHVVDLAQAHLSALSFTSGDNVDVFNIGTGKGYSVFEVLEAFEQASGVTIPYEIVSRRPGDVAQCFADPSLAEELLGWSAQYDLKRMMEDHWRWQKSNPKGYT